MYQNRALNKWFLWDQQIHSNQFGKLMCKMKCYALWWLLRAHILNRNMS